VGNDSFGRRITMKHTSLYLCFITVLLLVTVCTQTPDPGITTEALEEEIRSGFIKQVDVWNSRDFDAMDWDSTYPRGFGYRTMAPRIPSDIPQENRKQLIENFFNTFEYYKIKPEDFNVMVDGDVGIIWGFFVEDFQEVGKPPERNRVRFSGTARRTENGRWITLLGHRDIQPFDEKGQYIRKYLENNP
jgi:hypothetical protein